MFQKKAKNLLHKLCKVERVQSLVHHRSHTLANWINWQSQRHFRLHMVKIPDHQLAFLENLCLQSPLLTFSTYCNSHWLLHSTHNRLQCHFCHLVEDLKILTQGPFLLLRRHLHYNYSSSVLLKRCLAVSFTKVLHHKYLLVTYLIVPGLIYARMLNLCYALKKYRGVVLLQVVVKVRLTSRQSSF